MPFNDLAICAADVKLSCQIPKVLLQQQAGGGAG
jgi:hypothetical protein